MHLVRIQRVKVLDGRTVELMLTNGQLVRRDLGPLLAGPAFALIRADDHLFARVDVVAGGLAWPDGQDLCPDTILWGRLPADGAVPDDLRSLEVST